MVFLSKIDLLKGSANFELENAPGNLNGILGSKDLGKTGGSIGGGIKGGNKGKGGSRGNVGRRGGSNKGNKGGNSGNLGTIGGIIGIEWANDLRAGIPGDVRGRDSLERRGELEGTNGKKCLGNGSPRSPKGS